MLEWLDCCFNCFSLCTFYEKSDTYDEYKELRE